MQAHLKTSSFPFYFWLKCINNLFKIFLQIFIVITMGIRCWCFLKDMMKIKLWQCQINDNCYVLAPNTFTELRNSIKKNLRVRNVEALEYHSNQLVAQFEYFHHRVIQKPLYLVISLQPFDYHRSRISSAKGPPSYVKNTIPTISFGIRDWCTR